MSRILPFTEFDEFLQKTEQQLTEDQLNDPDLMKTLEGAGFEIRGTKAVREEFLVHKIRTAILNGLRPTMPPSTPPFLATIVRQCWSAVPEERPSFAEIIAVISEKLGIVDVPQITKKKLPGVAGGIKMPGLADASKKAAHTIKGEEIKDDGDYRIKVGTGAAVNEKIINLRKELKEKKKAAQEKAAAAAAAKQAAGDAKPKL